MRAWRTSLWIVAILLIGISSCLGIGTWLYHNILPWFNKSYGQLRRNVYYESGLVRFEIVSLGQPRIRAIGGIPTRYEYTWKDTQGYEVAFVARCIIDKAFEGLSCKEIQKKMEQIALQGRREEGWALQFQESFRLGGGNNIATLQVYQKSNQLTEWLIIAHPQLPGGFVFSYRVDIHKTDLDHYRSAVHSVWRTIDLLAVVDVDTVIEDIVPLDKQPTVP